MKGSGANMLKNFFQPKSVAVIGASREPGKVGYVVVDNLVRYGYEGEIYPINPKADEILSLKAYPSVRDVEGEIDLAVVVVPAKFVLQIIEDCGAKKIDSVIIISAGFKESGSEGSALERQLAARTKELGMRVLGPNCLGLINTRSKLNASFAQGMCATGSIAFFSQSGALCTAVLDWAIRENLGFSKFISLGNKMDVSESDLLRALAADPDTSVILGYIEGVKDGAEFMKTARNTSKKKPVIIMKSGGTAAGARAASSHTGTLAGSETAFTAAFRQCGVIRAENIESFFDQAIAFAYQPLPKDSRLAIVTNAGGPGIIAADVCERSNLTMASFEQNTIEKLRTQLPPTAALYNPVDVIGDAKADRYRVALEAVESDPGVDAILLILTPQAMTEPDETAGAVVEIAGRKPIVANFMGGAGVAGGIKILQDNKIPNYPFPERAIAALDKMVQYKSWRDQPTPGYATFDVDKEKVVEIVEKHQQEGQANLSGSAPMDVLDAYGFSVPGSGFAHTSDEAIEIARRFGYPVVMKIASPDILHKSDVGGVKLGLSNDDEVRQAFEDVTSGARRYMPQATILGVTMHEMALPGKEVILGMTADPDFGPLLMFGLGGIYVEVLKDVVFRIAPINLKEANTMVREIRSYPLLRGVRGEEPADIEAIVESILRLSQLVTDFPQIVEMDINPLRVLTAGRGAIAIDARFTIRI